MSRPYMLLDHDGEPIVLSLPHGTSKTGRNRASRVLRYWRGEDGEGGAAEGMGLDGLSRSAIRSVAQALVTYAVNRPGSIGGGGITFRDIAAEFLVLLLEPVDDARVPEGELQEARDVWQQREAVAA